ncbi:hypothetical protein F5Y17DRAFT_454383 [Xylariaceae sp. FL0594]|nr:hypothetical protein F5Y17DRAFT_454383 [Xylariaceae sp. FL0594]
MFTLSEESKERIGKLIEVSRVAIHYGNFISIEQSGKRRGDEEKKHSLTQVIFQAILEAILALLSSAIRTTRRVAPYEILF